MTSSTLTIEKSEGVVTLTLNRPKAMNALSQELRRALVDAFEALENDDEARVDLMDANPELMAEQRAQVIARGRMQSK